MAKIEGMNSLIEKLKKMGDDDRFNVSVVVGYTQSYAITVHEDLEAKHRPGKQAKYLEGPAREKAKEIADIIFSNYRKTKDAAKALLVGGLYLQRESQKVVPVDTSALRASAFTALDRDVPRVAAAAYAKSETIRKRQ
jgi:hypothetical protein